MPANQGSDVPGTVIVTAARANGGANPRKIIVPKEMMLFMTSLLPTLFSDKSRQEFFKANSSCANFAASERKRHKESELWLRDRWVFLRLSYFKRVGAGELQEIVENRLQRQSVALLRTSKLIPNAAGQSREPRP